MSEALGDPSSQSARDGFDDVGAVSASVGSCMK
jgi:hypothetical protein